MLTVTIMGNKGYAIDIGDIRDADSEQLDRIHRLVEEGNVTILCSDLEDMEDFDFEVEMVE